MTVFGIRVWSLLTSAATGFLAGDRKVLCDSPIQRSCPFSELCPELLTFAFRVWQDQSQDFAATDKAVVPSEIVVEQEVESGRLAGAQRLDSALLDFGFEAASSQRAFDAAIGVKEGLCADLLRAGTFDA